MKREKTGDKFTRAVGRKGISSDGDTDWLIKDMSEELKSWGACRRSRRKADLEV